MVLKILFRFRRRRLDSPGGCCTRALNAGFLLLVLVAMGASAAFGFDTAVTPNASPEAQSLLAYFSDIYGKKILSGQQEGWRGTNALGFELAYITNTTGKLPALLALKRLETHTGK